MCFLKSHCTRQEAHRDSNIAVNCMPFDQRTWLRYDVDDCRVECFFVGRAIGLYMRHTVFHLIAAVRTCLKQRDALLACFDVMTFAKYSEMHTRSKARPRV